MKATRARVASALLAAGTSFVEGTLVVEGTLADSAFVEAVSMRPAVVALVVVGKQAAAVA